MDFDYIVADPTGNITVLITSGFDAVTRNELTAEAFRLVPDCEQAGFIMEVSDEQIRLEMMGGEFCGNATLSTAAWHAYCHGIKTGKTAEVKVDSSGADDVLTVSVTRLDDEDGQPAFEGTVEMPVPSVSSIDGYPLVSFGGISHLIVPSDEYTDDEAEQAVVSYADKLGVQAMGMMLCSDYEALISGALQNDSITIRPLVYVPGSGTVVWEHGCASGSTAAGYYRAYVDASAAATHIRQPGGVISMQVRNGRPFLTGKVLLRSF